MNKKRMYNVYGKVYGTKFLGKYFAASPEKAIEMASEEHDSDSITLCHECSDEVEDGLTVEDEFAEEAE